MNQVQKVFFDHLDQRKRAALINCLSGFKSANLIGTTSSEGVDNLSIVSSCFHLGANPALMGLIIRPSSADRDRHTFENIKETRFCTLNHITEQMMIRAHQTSARYSKEENEFEMVGLRHIRRDGFLAPYVEESPVQIGLELKEHQHLVINGCEFLILEIQHLYTCPNWVQPDGFLDIEAAGSLCVSGLDSYHKTQRFSRLSYAKPGQIPTPIPLKGSDN